MSNPTHSLVRIVLEGGWTEDNVAAVFVVSNPVGKESTDTSDNLVNRTSS